MLGLRRCHARNLSAELVASIILSMIVVTVILEHSLEPIGAAPSQHPIQKIYRSIAARKRANLTARKTCSWAFKIITDLGFQHMVL